jgi:hypothetical protein
VWPLDGFGSAIERGLYVAQIDKNTTSPYDVDASAPFTLPECVDPRGCCFQRAGRQLPTRDFLTVRCERTAHDAQNSYRQPHRCCARVSGARHRRAAVIAALTALTLPSTVPR